MDWVGIHSALITHVAALHYEPAAGNALVLRETARHPRLLPCWVITPTLARETGGAGDLVGRMQREGVRAAKVFPLAHKFLLNGDALGALLSELARASIPLLVEAKDAPPQFLADLRDLCRAHSELNVLAQAVSWAEAQCLMEVMDDCENLMTDSSMLQLHNGMKYLCDRHGPERICFGTRGPHASIGAARAFVDYSDLDAEARQKIAGGNLARLLHLDVIPGEPSPCQRDAIGDQTASGEPITACPVLDAHTHVLQDGGRGAANVPMPGGDMAGLVTRASRLGIGMLCVSAWAGVTWDAAWGNRIVEQGMATLADDGGLYFDISAVLNPTVLRLAIETFGPTQLLYGTDNPVFYLRGRRQWSGLTYVNRTDYPFHFNKVREPPDVEATYTLYLYEALRALKMACTELDLSRTQVESVFYRNTEHLVNGIRIRNKRTNRGLARSS